MNMTVRGTDGAVKTLAPEALDVLDSKCAAG